MALREFQLKYGKGFVSFKIPQEEILYELEGKNYPALADLQQTYRFALDHPIDSPPLREIVKTGRKSGGNGQRHNPGMAEETTRCCPFSSRR